MWLRRTAVSGSETGELCSGGREDRAGTEKTGKAVSGAFKLAETIFGGDAGAGSPDDRKYEVQVLPVNCEQLRAEDIREILGQVLLEFPVTEIDFSIPKWLEILPNSHWLKSEVIQAVRGMMDRTVHMRDVALALPEETGEAIRRIRIVSMKMDDGSVQAVVEAGRRTLLSDPQRVCGNADRGRVPADADLEAVGVDAERVMKGIRALTQARKKGYGGCHAGTRGDRSR